MNHQGRSHWEAVGALLLANFLWGLSFPVIIAVSQLHAAAAPGASGWFIATMTVAPRFLLAAAVLAAWWIWRRRRRDETTGRPNARELGQGVALGLFAAGGMLFQNDGLQHTEASTSAFLSQFYAILIPLWVVVRTRRLPSLTLVAGVILVLIGGAILADFDLDEMRLGRGETETLIGSCFFAGQILVLGRADCANNRVLPVTLVMFITEAVVFSALALTLAPELSALIVPWRSSAWIAGTLVLTFFCTIGAFVLMNTFQPRITPTEAGLIYCIEPVFASALALFLPGWISAWSGINYENETFTHDLLIGGGLMTAANVLLQLRTARRGAAASGT